MFFEIFGRELKAIENGNGSSDAKFAHKIDNSLERLSGWLITWKSQWRNEWFKQDWIFIERAANLANDQVDKIEDFLKLSNGEVKNNEK